MPAACPNHHRHPHVQAPPHLNAELKEPVGSANTTLNQVPCTRCFQQIASPHPLLRRKPVSVLFLHPPPMVAESGGIMRKSPGRDWKCCPGQARSSPAQPPLGVEKRLPSGDRWRLACPRAAPPPAPPAAPHPAPAPCLLAPQTQAWDPATLPGESPADGGVRGRWASSLLNAAPWTCIPSGCPAQQAWPSPTPSHPQVCTHPPHMHGHGQSLAPCAREGPGRSAQPPWESR